MVQCPSCKRQQEPRLTCQSCGAPLAVHLDSFAALGLPRKLNIDPLALESVYHELGRQVHPDRFASSPAMVRSASLVSTALLTASYRTLKDPVSRGRYWLELNGEKLSENNKQVPPDLAETVFEVQEQLSEFREAPREDQLRTAIEEQRAELTGKLEGLLGELNGNFAEWDSGPDSNKSKLAVELKTILSRIAYLRTLVRDVDRELERSRLLALSG